MRHHFKEFRLMMQRNRPIGYPWIDWCLNRRNRELNYRLFILVLTFLCYVGYHQSRKPISVVKSVLHQNCSKLTPPSSLRTNADQSQRPKALDRNWCNWPPFNKENWSQLLGSLDYAYLFAYAIGMFFSGHLAERLNLRHFLASGMILSGLTTAAFGLAFFLRVRTIYYFLFIQIVGGVVQSSGWPSVVTLMGNWFGKSRRGFIMGLWNSHTSVGNILGSVLAGVFVSSAWGWSFVVPGLLMTIMGALASLLIISHPSDAACEDSLVLAFELERRREDEKALLAAFEEEEEGGPNQAETGVEEAFADSPDMEPSLATRVRTESEGDAITILGALHIPGVVPFALVLFFAKLVSYTFLYWLPNYIKMSGGVDPRKAADLSTLFDLGGIFGGVVAGAVSDCTGASATVCCLMLFLAIPGMYLYQLYGASSLGACILLLFITGFLVNGPYALITTAVSADLGTHHSLRGRTHALATVTAIIDGTGSMGAALGPLLTGLIVPSGWRNVFYMLIGADVAALLVCTYIVVRGDELLQLLSNYKSAPLTANHLKRCFVFVAGAVLVGFFLCLVNLVI